MVLRSTIPFSIPISLLDALCQRWKIQELALFGSAVRGDFRTDSDIDLLVTFSDEANWGLLAHVEMQHELQTLLGRAVDMISRRAIIESTNWLRRQSILSTAQVIYRSDENRYAP